MFTGKYIKVVKNTSDQFVLVTDFPEYVDKEVLIVPFRHKMDADNTAKFYENEIANQVKLIPQR